MTLSRAHIPPPKPLMSQNSHY